MQGNKHALLVIDIINVCCDQRWEKKEWNITFNNIRKMIPRLIAFIDWYKKNTEGKVIYVNAVKWVEEEVASNIAKLYAENPKARFYTTHDIDESIKFYKVAPQNDDIVITKNTYDAFAIPEMNQVLQQHDIQTLLITGVYADGCVQATMSGGFSKGYNLLIIKDLVESMDGKKGLQTLLETEAWQYLYGPVITSEEYKRRFQLLYHRSDSP